MRVIRVLEVIKVVYVIKNFQVVEYVLGFVLCVFGCFSVYRCLVLRKILFKYVFSVERVFDFFIKDMGEDRWFCIFMVIFIFLFFIKNCYFIYLMIYML